MHDRCNTTILLLTWCMVGANVSTNTNIQHTETGMSHNTLRSAQHRMPDPLYTCIRQQHSKLTTARTTQASITRAATTLLSGVVLSQMLLQILQMSSLDAIQAASSTGYNITARPSITLDLISRTTLSMPLPTGLQDGRCHGAAHEPWQPDISLMQLSTHHKPLQHGSADCCQQSSHYSHRLHRQQHTPGHKARSSFTLRYIQRLPIYGPPGYKGAAQKK
jgi:hypothetical protein